jgi:hypothetical protein
MGNLAKEKVEESINRLKEKQSRIYLFVQDTKGNAKASVRFIYQMAKSLQKNNFNPILLHEREDYTGVESWLGKEYMEIPHQSIEKQNLEITPDDFLVIPEIYGFVMDQVKQLPCAKIVLTQQYAHMLETLQPGQTWSQFGFHKCITTTLSQKNQIEKIMRQVDIDLIKPTLSEVFVKNEKPSLPIIAVHTKEQSDAINLIKTFYLRFPQYRWFTFRDMRGLTEQEFANSLKECCLSVWIDEKSGLGTFPLESMSCGVPCVGKLPELQPDWLNEDNGIWVTNSNYLVDVIADFLQNWLEDNIKPELFQNMDLTSREYMRKELFEERVSNLFQEYFNKRVTSFEEQLSKTEE